MAAIALTFSPHALAERIYTELTEEAELATSDASPPRVPQLNEVAATIEQQIRVLEQLVAAIRATDWQSHSLYGLTESSDGQFSLLDIDPTTGMATTAADFTIAELSPYQLEFHGPSGRFLTLQRSDPPSLCFLDTENASAEVIPITGLPKGAKDVSGLTYDPNNDSIWVTCGSNNKEDLIAKVGLDGKVVSSTLLRLGDRDILAWHPQQERLLAIDFNGGTPRIAAVNDPFENWEMIADPPKHQTLVDAVVTPATGRLLAVDFASNALVEVVVDAESREINGFPGASFAPSIVVVQSMNSRYQRVAKCEIEARLVGLAVAPRTGQ